ncbi:hypothetical protein [Galbibacter sp. BG1]
MNKINELSDYFFSDTLNGDGIFNNHHNVINKIKNEIKPIITIDDNTNFYHLNKGYRLNKLENIFFDKEINSMCSKEFYFGYNYWYYTVVDKLNNNKIIEYTDFYYHYWNHKIIENNPFEELFSTF